MKNHAIKKITLVSFLLFTLAGCSPRASFIPEREDLPDAVTGAPYFQKINIVGGRVITDRKPIPGKIEPDHNGLFIENCRLPERVLIPESTILFNGNCVEIKGTPVRTGTVKVTLDGMLYGNMLVSPGNFEKTYLIKVVAGQE